MRERHFADYVDVEIKAFINHSVFFFFYQESCIFEILQSPEFVAHYMKCFLTCSRHNPTVPVEPRNNPKRKTVTYLS